MINWTILITIVKGWGDNIMKKKILLVAIIICLGLTGCGKADYAGLDEYDITQYYNDKYIATKDSSCFKEMEKALDAYRKGKELPVPAEEIKFALAKPDNYKFPGAQDPTPSPTPTPSDEELITSFTDEMNLHPNIACKYESEFAFDSSDEGKYSYYNPYTVLDTKSEATVEPSTNRPTIEEIMEIERDLAFLYTTDIPRGALYSIGAFGPDPEYVLTGFKGQYGIVNYVIGTFDSGEEGCTIYFVDLYSPDKIKEVYYMNIKFAKDTTVIASIYSSYGQIEKLDIKGILSFNVKYHPFTEFFTDKQISTYFSNYNFSYGDVMQYATY